MTRQERSGWRDEWISRKHREWGSSLGLVDIDWLVIEYSEKTPKAIIDYKNSAIKEINLNESIYVVQRKLGDMAGLPAFIVWYSKDPIWFKILPLNSFAKNYIGRPCFEMTEEEYVAFLFEIRGRQNCI